MKTQTIIVAETLFTVEYFHATEGGMDTEQFGKTCETVEEALVVLHEARAAKPTDDWVIVGRSVTTATTSSSIARSQR